MSPSKELALADHMEQMTRVAELRIEGNDPREIAKIMGIPRADVLHHIDQYRALVAEDKTMQARAKESLYNMDRHFDKVTKGYYEVIEEVDNAIATGAVTNQMLSVKTNALKAIVELESKRVQALKDFGAYDSMEMGNQIAETERKQEILMKILREVTNKCPQCRDEVRDRISEITRQPEAIVIVEQR